MEKEEKGEREMRKGEGGKKGGNRRDRTGGVEVEGERERGGREEIELSLIHISEPTRPY